MNKSKTAVSFQENINSTDSQFQFTWPGKQEAILLANEPIKKYFIPQISESHKFTETENIFIEGDNLDALKLLQNQYQETIKFIYIDPPYNTGNQFIYNDNFKINIEDYQGKTKQADKLNSNYNLNGRIHTKWLNMIYPRLLLAKNLLCQEGMIIISIDDHELHHLRMICDEIFGEKNFIGTFVINTTPNARDYGHMAKMHEYAVFYAKNITFTKTYLLDCEEKNFKFKDKNGGFNIHPLYNSNEAFTPLNRPNLYYPFYIGQKIKDNINTFFEISLENNNNTPIFPPKSEKNNIQFVWRWGKEKAQKNLNQEIVGYKNSNNEFRIVQKMRHTKKRIRSLLNQNAFISRKGTAEVEDLFQEKIASFPKPIALIKTFIKMATQENDIILDFFAGSATTAHATMELNAEDSGKRKFIMIQNSEQCKSNRQNKNCHFTKISDLGKERIRLAAKQIEKKYNHNKIIDLGFKVFRIE